MIWWFNLRENYLVLKFTPEKDLYFIKNVYSFPPQKRWNVTTFAPPWMKSNVYKTGKSGQTAIRRRYETNKPASAKRENLDSIILLHILVLGNRYCSRTYINKRATCDFYFWYWSDVRKRIYYNGKGNNLRSYILMPNSSRALYYRIFSFD